MRIFWLEGFANNQIGDRRDAAAREFGGTINS